MRFPTAIGMLACFVAALAFGCTNSSPTRPSTTLADAGPGPITPGPNSPVPPGVPPIAPSGVTAEVIAVGDIGMCSERAAVERTAALVDRLPGQLWLAGDLAYMHGTIGDFNNCFDPAWGRFRQRWYPVPGNHEYETLNAGGYRQYFGAAATPGGRTFYAIRAGDWLVLMLDSAVPARIGSEQYEFVRSTLSQPQPPCTAAVWHHPVFSSGPNGPSPFMRDLWRLLYEHHAEVVVSGHDHLYERFGKQDVDGRSDARGLRQFIAGTGGARLYEVQRQEPNSQARHRAHGVLRLTLLPTTYQWAFVDVSGAVLDAGADGCH